MFHENMEIKKDNTPIKTGYLGISPELSIQKLKYSFNLFFKWNIKSIPIGARFDIESVKLSLIMILYIIKLSNFK